MPADHGSTIPAGEATGQKIHRRGAHEAGGELARRPLIEGTRRPRLVQPPAIDQGDTVGEAQRLYLIVRHVENRLFKRAVEPAKLRAEIQANTRVQIR